MSYLTHESINQLILQKQHLTPNSKIDDIIQISKDLCGLQATGTFEPYVYLFCRCNNFQKEDLEKLWYEIKNLIKIRGMRNTLFIIPKQDTPIIHNATTFLKESRFEGFFTHSDFTRMEYNELETEILHVLKEEPLIATDIKKRINTDRNISIILSLMCDKLLLVRYKPPNGWKDRRITYSLMKNMFPDLNFEVMEERVSNEMLVLRYIKGYGPVTEQDISWWTGIPITKIRNVLESIQTQVEPLNFHEDVYYTCKSDIKTLKKSNISKDPIINLLASLDPYLMGYKNRKRFINDDIYNLVFDRSGNATSTILLNGTVIGIWDFQSKPEPIVKFLLFQKITKEILNGIKKHAKQIGEFILEHEVKIQKCTNLIPLTKRSAGTFMRPLRNC